jgi:hypothetical protein
MTMIASPALNQRSPAKRAGLSAVREPSMDIITLVLLLAAAIVFALATIGVAARVNLIALGLLLWVLVPLLTHIDALG